MSPWSFTIFLQKESEILKNLPQNLRRQQVFLSLEVPELLLLISELLSVLLVPLTGLLPQLLLWKLHFVGRELHFYHFGALLLFDYFFDYSLVY